MSNRLMMADLAELEQRLGQLDEWTRALEQGSDNLDELRQAVFPDGDSPDDESSPMETHPMTTGTTTTG